MLPSGKAVAAEGNWRCSRSTLPALNCWRKQELLDWLRCGGVISDWLMKNEGAADLRVGKRRLLRSNCNNMRIGVVAVAIQPRFRKLELEKLLVAKSPKR